MEALAIGPPVDRILVDWARPWYRPWGAIGAPIARAINQGMPIWDACNALRGTPVRFVAQVPLPAGVAYEQAIHETGNCPTRNGLHDFFNALCWRRYPQTKLKLNRLQVEQIAKRGIGATRGAARDALTLFDENAALLQAPDALWDALVAKNWQRLFGPLRAQWAQARVHPFGHALLEKLAVPRKSITAHVYRVPSHLPDDETMDNWLASHLSADTLADKPFANLPILGVPGWWAGNMDPAFYDDPAVFRRPHAHATQGQ